MKKNLPMSIASILLCLVLLSSYLVSGLYARYTTRASGSDSARIAKFVIDSDSLLLNGGTLEQVYSLSIAPGKTLQTITIDNQSEVTVECQFEIVNITQNIPLTFTYANGNEEVGINEKMIIEKGQNLLSFNINWEANENALNCIGMVDLIKITLKVNQVD